jgi:hypothetical protein
MSADTVTSKTFAKGTRNVPKDGQKADKWYPTVDTPKPKSVSRERETERSPMEMDWGEMEREGGSGGG